MQYVLKGNKVYLVKYVVSYVIDTENDQQIITEICINANEVERIKNIYRNAKVTEIDISAYEWLNGKEFTREQVQAGEVEKAIEMGETAYKEYLYANDRDAQMLELDYRLSLIELGVGGENL